MIGRRLQKELLFLVNLLTMMRHHGCANKPTRPCNYLFASWIVARLTLRGNPNRDLRLTDAGGVAQEVGRRTGSSANENLAARSEAHRMMPATWLIVWDIIIGIWAV